MDLFSLEDALSFNANWSRLKLGDLVGSCFASPSSLFMVRLFVAFYALIILRRCVFKSPDWRVTIFAHPVVAWFFIFMYFSLSVIFTLIPPLNIPLVGRVLVVLFEVTFVAAIFTTAGFFFAPRTEGLYSVVALSQHFLNIYYVLIEFLLNHIVLEPSHWYFFGVVAMLYFTVLKARYLVTGLMPLPGFVSPHVSRQAINYMSFLGLLALAYPLHVGLSHVKAGLLPHCSETIRVQWVFLMLVVPVYGMYKSSAENILARRQIAAERHRQNVLRALHTQEFPSATAATYREVGGRAGPTSEDVLRESGLEGTSFVSSVQAAAAAAPPAATASATQRTKPPAGKKGKPRK